ncbi:hypothetical protein ILYODFUR_034852 [Ilyodon furcidens]|uniref:Uncharacterized protein n=1 Tax=Ilyodon furcidens TaxID=33524 RepID=A0ABV0T604_9TELE
MLQVTDWMQSAGCQAACGSCRVGKMHSSAEEQECPGDRSACLGLAAEQERLERLDLPHDVVSTIQGALAAFTTASYTSKWTAFHCWCAEKGVKPISCPLGCTLSLLQQPIKRNFSFQHH